MILTRYDYNNGSVFMTFLHLTSHNDTVLRDNLNCTFYAHHLSSDSDYVFSDVKFGGNAQSFSSDRCVHHTSLLWDYDANRMIEYLKVPSKQPNYRQVCVCVRER